MGLGRQSETPRGVNSNSVTGVPLDCQRTRTSTTTSFVFYKKCDVCVDAASMIRWFRQFRSGGGECWCPSVAAVSVGFKDTDRGFAHDVLEVQGRSRNTSSQRALRAVSLKGCSAHLQARGKIFIRSLHPMKIFIRMLESTYGHARRRSKKSPTKSPTIWSSYNT